MESLSHILCVKCYSVIGQDLEILHCSNCLLWQHKRCSHDVPEKFYERYYIAIALGEKPLSWLCHYCSSCDENVKKEPMSPVSTAAVKGNNTPLVLPPKPPCTLSDSSTVCNTDEDEFNDFTLNPLREETVVNHQPNSHSLLSDKSSVGHRQVLIDSQPILSHSSSKPVLYTLYQAADGQKEVEDSEGNIFISTKVTSEGATYYQCWEEGCRFQVRVCEIISEFLCAGKDKAHHTHTRTTCMSANFKENVCDDNNSTLYSNSPLDQNIMCNDDDSSLSPIIPAATDVSVHSRTFSYSAHPLTYDESFCAGSTDSELSPQYTGYKLTQITSRSSPSDIFSSACSSADHSCEEEDESMDISDLVDCLSYDGDTSVENAELNCTSHQVPCVSTPAKSGESLYVSFSSESFESRDDLGIDDLCKHLENAETPTRETTETGSMLTSPDATIPCFNRSLQSNKGDSEGVSYNVTREGNQNVLRDSLGFIYNSKHPSSKDQLWHCMRRSYGCLATVFHHHDNQFIPSGIQHNHLASTHRVLFPSPLAAQDPEPNHESTSAWLESRARTPSPPHLTRASLLERSPRRGIQTPTPPTLSPEVDHAVLPDLEKQLPTKENDSSRQSEVCDDSPTKTRMVCYEIDTCFSSKSRARTMIVSSDGHLFKTKREDQGVTTWHCSGCHFSGQKCKAVLTLTLKDNTDPWLVTHSGATLNGQHSHMPNYLGVTLAKLKMMIRRSVYCGSGTDEFPSTLISRASEGLDFNGQPYLDASGNPVISEQDRQNLPLQPVEKRVLTTFVYNQKKSYKKENNKD